MRILFLCGSLEPGRDGVGDYTRSLAAACTAQGHKCAMIALNDTFVRQSVGSDGELRLPAAMDWERRAARAVEFRDKFRPDWLSFQIVAYGLQPKGILWSLVPHLQKVAQGFPVHIMFHELWIGMPLEAPFKHHIVGALQRRSIRRLCEAIRPRLVTTSNALYIEALKRIRVEALPLPLFGNIPIEAAPFSEALLPRGVTMENRSEWMIGLFFGGLYPEWKAEPFMGIARRAAQKAGKKLGFVSAGRVGAPGQAVWQNLQRDYPDVAFSTLGEQSFETVSALMQESDFGVAASPWQLIGKSGSAAAMLDHGLPVIVTREDAQTRFPVPEATQAEPLFHRCDDALEAKLAAGLPKAAPHPRRDAIAATFCAALTSSARPSA